MTKSTIVLFLLVVRLTAGTYPHPELHHKPLTPNTAEWVRSKFFQSKHSDQFPSVQERFQRMGVNDRSFSQRTDAKHSPRSAKASSIEIDSILVFSQKDTILQIAQIGERFECAITKIFKNGVYIDSVRETHRWETDNKGNSIFRSVLLEEWSGEQWVPDYRNTEHQTYEQGSNFRRSIFEIYENGEWMTLITDGSLFLCDRYGYNISWTTFCQNSENDWTIQYDTLFLRRSYSIDSTSCDAAWDSTLTFLISNVNRPINNSQELLDAVAHGNRQLRSRTINTRANDGSAWSSQYEDLIDGEWKLRNGLSIEDSSDNIDIFYNKYYQDTTLVIFRTICESGPSFMKYTNAQLLDGAWVFQTRTTVYYYFDTIVYSIDTLRMVEQWRGGQWEKYSINRTQLNDQHQVEKISWVSWRDTSWIPCDGGMYIYSNDSQSGYWFLGNTLTIHRSIDNSTAVTEQRPQLPHEFELRQNYPNPFNPSTKLGFTLQVSGLTTLKIYDALGREVSTLVNENLVAGVYHERTFDASHLASGIYFARLTSGGLSQMKKMSLIK